MTFIGHFKKIDWVLVISAICLTSFGLVSIYGMAVNSGDFTFFKKQLFFFIIGFFLMLFFSFFDYRTLRANSYLIFSLYIIFCFLLLGLLFFAQEIRGIKGWYRIGPFSFDPIPFLAIILLLLLSRYFSKYHIEIYNFRHLLTSFGYTFIPFFLIFLQPNLGSGLLLIFLWFSVIMFSGIKISHFLILLLIFSLIFSFSWFFLLKDYQKQRVITFLNPRLDPRGISWNINQSKIAIGSGGILGKGIGKGSQTQSGFLPEPKTDFIFSAIAEETGFLGISLLFLFLLIFIWRIIKIVLYSSNNFSRLFASGFAFFFFIQTFINIGMSFGILPIIGVPLPLVSYGGSQLLSFYLGLGLIQSIKVYG
ncbi:rod shape-determining protein RodA [bacterium (Candidatus Gribaldobacteria) CG_4_9_14_3_um_filter_33_9]|nr:MAG: rod shape-determining protein RodA [bacterium (Candidatus Gribaldobacteria) CG_4_9_14_3_um_filter_33_9]